MSTSQLSQQLASLCGIDLLKSVIAAAGETWTDNRVTQEQILQRYGPVIERGSPALRSDCEQNVREHFAGTGATPT